MTFFTPITPSEEGFAFEVQGQMPTSSALSIICSSPLTEKVYSLPSNPGVHFLPIPQEETSFSEITLTLTYRKVGRCPLILGQQTFDKVGISLGSDQIKPSFKIILENTLGESEKIFAGLEPLTCSEELKLV